MKFKNLSIMVTKLRLLLRLHNQGVSQRQIAKQLKLSRTSIRSYMTRFQESSYSPEELESLEDNLLLKLSQGEIYKQERDSRYEQLKPLLEYYAKESKRPKVTLLLLWEEYKQQFQDDAYSYSSFKNHVQEYINSHTYTYHNTHKPGDVLQVDFAGDHLYLTDPNTAEKISVVVLCCTLPCSGYTFAYALPDASQENLFPALSKCLSYIGGVPNKILSDNMKQWVKRRDKDGPIFTDAALEFGTHYSTMIDATKVRKPTYKASVEASVHYIYERIYAAIRDEIFYTIEDLNTRILELLDVFNARKMQNKEYSREEFFELNEKDMLHPLPTTPFSIKYTKTRHVGNNYHIYISTHQYSVPFEYVNKTVTVIYDKDTVEIYDSTYTRIAIHKRSFKRYGYTTVYEHMPDRHQAYEYKKGCKNAAYYLSRALQIDPSVKTVLQKVFNNAVCIEQAYNTCEAILQLDKLDHQAFINSCKYIEDKLEYANYRIIKQIMNNKTYNISTSNQDNTQPKHINLRGKDAFLN